MAVAANLLAELNAAPDSAMPTHTLDLIVNGTRSAVEVEPRVLLVQRAARRPRPDRDAHQLRHLELRRVSPSCSTESAGEKLHGLYAARSVTDLPRRDDDRGDREAPLQPCTRCSKRFGPRTDRAVRLLHDRNDRQRGRPPATQLRDPTDDGDPETGLAAATSGRCTVTVMYRFKAVRAIARVLRDARTDLKELEEHRTAGPQCVPNDSAAAFDYVSPRRQAA